MATDTSKTFDPQTSEERWYAYWLRNGYFASKPNDKQPYTVVIPPPNVTGVLHMGHMLNNTLQDVLVRRARMLGKNACWVPGTDHASIATEAKVVQRLRKEGIRKGDLTREEFLQHAWKWKEEHGGIILEQLKKLGASCDWDRTAFTLDEGYSRDVINVFVDLYNKGLIYRGLRMVNWDVAAQTAVSDEEVIHRDVNGKLYYVRYRNAQAPNGYLVVATTRPETILGDTAVCVNPADERYASLVGTEVEVPLGGRKVKIIADDYVDMEFGTGCLKVTPAHDVNDYEIGLRHNLEVRDTFNADGTLNDLAGDFAGMERFEARKAVVAALEKANLIEKVEDHAHKVGYSERTDAVIEPRLSQQWFLSMGEISKPALKHVMDDTIQFHPPKFKNTYRHWMENIKDWCISRQLWWGHRIPAWYYGSGEGDFVVSATRDEALNLAREKSGNAQLQATDLRQDEDVLDTWFSSWLWPISVFNGFEDSEDFNYYYPTSDLVTAPEIMFFWVARMIIAGYEFKGQKPFTNVYYNGIVRDKQGRKMSKQLGNSPNPLDLIAQYGADGVRTGMLFSSPAGNDLLFDESLCEQGRNFNNKLWNAFRLIKGWSVEKTKQSMSASPAILWMENRMSQVIAEVNEHFARFRISDALMTLYKFTWDDFCSWYLEAVKPEYGKPLDQRTYDSTVQFLENILKLLHPFMPFITEEIWQSLKERTPEEALVIAEWPRAGHAEGNLLQAFETARDIVVQVRNIRNANQISPKVAVELIVKENTPHDRRFNELIRKLANLSMLRFADEDVPKAFSFMAGANQFFVPFNEEVDIRAERQKAEGELSYLKGFLTSVEKKLNNAGFVKGAPTAVLETERKKQADTLAKIAALEEKLKMYSSN